MTFNVRINYDIIRRCNSEHIFYHFRKKTHSQLPFLWQILQFLSIFSNTGVPLDNLLRPPRGTRPPGWEPLLYIINFFPMYLTSGNEPKLFNLLFRWTNALRNLVRPSTLLTRSSRRPSSRPRFTRSSIETPDRDSPHLQLAET
jgi:hypothetical protein